MFLVISNYNFVWWDVLDGGHRYVDSPVTHKQNETLQIIFMWDEHKINSNLFKKKIDFFYHTPTNNYVNPFHFMGEKFLSTFFYLFLFKLADVYTEIEREEIYWNFS